MLVQPKAIRGAETAKPHLARVSMLSFCDLAGSERVKKAINSERERQKAESLATQPSLSQPSQPSIKLKMDFSNFK